MATDTKQKKIRITKPANGKQACGPIPWDVERHAGTIMLLGARYAKNSVIAQAVGLHVNTWITYKNEKDNQGKFTERAARINELLTLGLENFEDQMVSRLVDIASDEKDIKQTETIWKLLKHKHNWNEQPQTVVNTQINLPNPYLDMDLNQLKQLDATQTIEQDNTND